MGVTASVCTEARSRISSWHQSVNILIIGECGHGKSSFINTMYFALTENRSTLIALTRNHPEFLLGAQYCRHDFHQNELVFYDTPGCSFSTEKEKQILKKIIHGIEPMHDMSWSDVDHFTENINNRIDYVIWVVNATTVIGQSTDIDSIMYFKEISDLVQSRCSTGMKKI